MYRTIIQRNQSMTLRLRHVTGRLKSSLANEKLKSKSVQEAARALQPGTKLHGYTVERVQDVPELFLTTVALNHDKTGAKHLHVAREDNNNTFSVAFRTTPLDSTGVPHILEHTVLCGSKKIPCERPFLQDVKQISGYIYECPYSK